tara:strand:+ start:660 stop:2174 length:1515 start_codon:yes stop_codon:yes gene_type:complete
MATHDYIIANASGAAVRADLNNALAAIVSNNSNGSEPATRYAYQWWADTTAGQLKLRNSANNAWIVIQELDGTMLMEDGTAAAPGLAFAADLDTGFLRPAANSIAISTAGTQRLVVDAAGQVDIGTGSIELNANGTAAYIGTITANSPVSTVVALNQKGILANGRSTAAADACVVTRQYTATGYNFIAQNAAGTTTFSVTDTGVIGTTGGLLATGAAQILSKSDTAGVVLGIFNAAGSSQRAWIDRDGSAYFSQGNILLNLDGSAKFAGGILELKNDGSQLATRGGNPAYLLESLTTGGYLSLYPGSATPSIQLNGNLGTGVFSGNLTAANVSDIRFKENITDANPQLADAVALGSQLKNWDWSDDAPLNDELRAKRFLGLVAQEAEKVCPGLAYTVPRTKQGAELTPEVVIPAVYETRIVPAVLDKKGKVIEAETTEQVIVTEEQVTPATYEKLDDSYKAINHDILVMKLLGAVAEQNARIETLETKNASVEARLTALEGGAS